MNEHEAAGLKISVWYAITLYNQLHNILTMLLLMNAALNASVLQVEYFLFDGTSLHLNRNTLTEFVTMIPGDKSEEEDL